MLKEMIQKTIEQGQGSFEVLGGLVRCLYRGPNGNKCAVGHLIPDDKYVPEMEVVPATRICEFIGIPYQDAFMQVQISHDLACEDEGNFVEAFKTRLKQRIELDLLPKEILEWI